MLRSSAKLAREVSAPIAGCSRLKASTCCSRCAIPIASGRALRTLACGASASSDWSYLAQRRFALFVINAIERGTRWCAGSAQDDPHSVGCAWRSRVSTSLSELRSAGAFASVPPDQAFLVICDERINDGERAASINILVQFAATHAGEYHSFMLTHSAERCDRAAGRWSIGFEATLVVSPRARAGDHAAPRRPATISSASWLTDRLNSGLDAVGVVFFHNTSCPFSCRASTRAITNSRSDSRFK